jgi:hypothetical protein
VAEELLRRENDKRRNRFLSEERHPHSHQGAKKREKMRWGRNDPIPRRTSGSGALASPSAASAQPAAARAPASCRAHWLRAHLHETGLALAVMHAAEKKLAAARVRTHAALALSARTELARPPHARAPGHHRACVGVTP